MKKSLYSIAITLMLLSCSKEDEWLDVKSNLNDIRPTTLKDFQAILDADNVMNASYPGIGLVSCDNLYLTTENYNALTQTERDAYVWAKKVDVLFDWQAGYIPVESANIILDGLGDLERTSENGSQYDNIKGAALFFRAFAYYGLLPVFSKPYNDASADSDLGLVLKNSSDVNIHPARATLRQTYKAMTDDLQQAIALLPSNVLYPSQPSKVAAMALLAKVYLNMEDYESAFQYADQALGLHDRLMDFNDPRYHQGALFPFPDFPLNEEVFFWAYQNTYFAVLPGMGTGYVDPQLYESYGDNDLRKSLFYQEDEGNHLFRGSYYGSISGVLSRNFCGLATNELFLIRAECAARLGVPEQAISDISTLLSHRYQTGTFAGLPTMDAEGLLRFILAERRKELPFTGQIRWEDLRRLNKDNRFAITVSRTLGQTSYTLAPGDSRYVYEIPDKEIQLSGLQQNQR